MSASVDLVPVGGAAAGAGWPHGRIHPCPATPPEISRLVGRLASGEAAEWMLLWDPRLGPPPAAEVERLVRHNLDVAHAGLRLGMAGLPELIDTVRPTWPFNRDLAPDAEGMSWRMSLRASLVRRSVVAALGPPAAGFRTLEGAALEWGHRLIRRGAWVLHRPRLVAPLPRDPVAAPAVPLADELLFVLRCFGRRWLRWAAARGILSGHAPRAALLAAVRAVARSEVPAQPAPYRRESQDAARRGAGGGDLRVSVLVPTVDRYPSLRTLLAQLDEQTHPPAQVVIVDQTPAGRRDHSLAEDFPDLPIELMVLEQAGQCTSRNAGLARVTGEAVLFLDDDDEVEPDLVERHVRRMAETGVDASCGVADEVGAGPLPEDFELSRLSDVFPTNNTLLRTEALGRSGLFDLAYDRGPRADGDLGMRLYLAGATMLLSPDIRVLHNHVPRGGLRTHGARAVTYAGSRSRLLVRHLPAVTELYLGRRYFSPRQRREGAWIRLAGTFSIRGGRLLRLAKVAVALLQLPSTLWTFVRRDRAARRMLEEGGFPRIPTSGREESTGAGGPAAGGGA